MQLLTRASANSLSGSSLAILAERRPVPVPLSRQNQNTVMRPMPLSFSSSASPFVSVNTQTGRFNVQQASYVSEDTNVPSALVQTLGPGYRDAWRQHSAR